MTPWRIVFNQTWRLTMFPPGRKSSGEITIYPPTGAAVSGAITFTTEKGSHMGEIVIHADEQNLSATVTYQDSEGNPTTPDTTPVWVVADETVATCTPTEDGLQAAFDILAQGVTSVSVTATETHDDGQFTDIVLTGLITVTAADAVTGSIDFTTDHVMPVEP